MTEYGNGGSFTVTMDGPFSGGGGGTTSEKLITIYAAASKWKGGTSPFAQVVAVENININNKVDIFLSAEQIQQLSEQTIAFTAENDGGIVTVYAIGDKPAIDVTFQATLSEVVNITGENITVIRGNTVSTNMPRANYNQTDETKSDFIENKPDEKINEALEKARNALPRAGGTMTGSIDMNGQKITGLNDPTSGNEAVNKNYVDESNRKIEAGKVDKSSVVNNFDTTEEGFVADARALKTLNDTKLSVSEVLVWENASPTSEFPSGTEISYDSGYEKYRLELNVHYGRTGPSIDFKPGEGLVASLMWADDGIYVSRTFDTTANGLKAKDGYQSKVKNDSVMVPIRIYGIKGVN